MKYLMVLVLLYVQAAYGQTALYDSIIAAETKPGMPGGVALIAKNGVIVYEKAWGMADVELEVPMQNDMVFCIGSVTKQFTAIAILRLAEQGKLSLDDELTKYIPDYAVNGHRITIEHLLTHTAGIPENGQKELPPSPRAYSPGEVVNTFKHLTIKKTPGEAYSYSNHGYIILGAIIEKVTGVPYKTYLEKEFFQPLGMMQTFYSDNARIWRHRASSYVYTRNGQIENGPEAARGSAASAGAIYSTVEDLLKWNQALVQYKLVKKETLDRAWTLYRLNNGKLSEYGYAWWAGELQGNRLVEHGGNAGGFMVHDIYFPDKKIFVAVFENFRGKLPELVATDLAAAALDRPLRYPQFRPDSLTLQSYTGLYTDSSGAGRYISLRNGKLWYQREWTGGFGVTPYAKDSVVFDNTGSVGQFVRDRNGKIAGLEIRSVRRAPTSKGYQWKIQKLSLAQELEKIVRKDGAIAALKQFYIMKEDTACYFIKEFQFNQLGYQALNNDLVVAELMFRFNVELFPRSANAFDSYGEALAKAGKREEAIVAYKTAVSLNPDNAASQQALAKLTKQP
ncbi:serine hydrolase domain-containing protein [Chitinophaga barathri]|uniref:Serine hydrolase n=1 Tax=Chitinophaga barathri TaxID=1647451 RepID=A0A3N4MGB5_9BACT|nr:serine hydrolase domain-containing protein [Chitinophaga barathri]RPD42881.1 serine hydrolase [Chitinophaga barathri]